MSKLAILEKYLKIYRNENNYLQKSQKTDLYRQNTNPFLFYKLMFLAIFHLVFYCL